MTGSPSASPRLPLLKALILPGLVFQSVVIAGGYGTGRELVEFFLSQGPKGALLGIAVATLVWSAVGAVTFEFARRVRAYDYRAFMQELLGRGAILYEVAYAGMLMLVLAVVAAASGEIVRDTFGLPYATGVALMMLLVGYLTLRGSELIERFLTLWSVLLYATYAVFAGWTVLEFGPEMQEALRSEPAGTGWALSGLRYAAYNIGILPAVLFVLRDHRDPRVTLAAGALVGPLAILPGLLFTVALFAAYPAVLDDAVPAATVLTALGSPTFQVIFQVVLLGTLVETGTGLIHALNERVAHAVEAGGRPFPDWGRSAVAVSLLALGAGLSSFGLVALIARGYGLMTWVFLLAFVLPVLTLGTWRIVRDPGV